MRRHLVVANQTLLGDPLLARASAAERLQEGLERFRALGADVEGEVGDARPIDAIRDVMLHAPPFDEIILSTLPPGLSRWLRQDLPHRIHRTFELPLSTVTARVAA